MPAYLHLTHVIADVPVSSLVAKKPRLLLRQGTLVLSADALREMVQHHLQRFKGKLESVGAGGGREIVLSGQHAIPILGAVQFRAGVTLDLTEGGGVLVRLTSVDAPNVPLPVSALRDTICEQARRAVAAPQGFTPGQGDVLWSVDLAEAVRERGFEVPPVSQLMVDADGIRAHFGAT